MNVASTLSLFLITITDGLSMQSPARAAPVKSQIDENEVKPHGGYKTKEEIQKAPTENHQCNLTRTSVKISFPELKSETFVNLLGYKEPNLVHLWRCKGVCGVTGRPIACMATKTVQKTIKMTFKTHLTKQHSKELIVGKERMKELVLEEHEECGCQCAGISASQCAATFNELTCECECEEKEFKQEKLRCEGRTSSFWDQRSCQCRSKSVSPRGIDAQDAFGCSGSTADATQFDPSMFESREPGVLNVASYVVLGCCLTVAIFLAITTVYYRRKVRRLLDRKEDEGPQAGGWEEKRVGGTSKRKPVWNHPNGRGHCPPEGPPVKTNSLGRTNRHERRHSSGREVDRHHIGFSAPLEAVGDLYQDQYDSHGVLIPREDDDLIKHYNG